MKLATRTDGIDRGTNILKVEVPKELRTRIRTGISHMDDALGGRGFTPSMVTLFTGTPGAGKTTLMLETANALTGKGAAVLFNTAEESLFQLKMTVERLRLRHGFIAGQDVMVPDLLDHCDEIRAANPKKPFFLIVDSLQTLDDGKFKSGRITSATSERALLMITDYCKEHFCNAVIIGQVTKDGKMAGSQKLKHMVDAFISLDVERKDKDLVGCRILTTEKNRFGGAGHIFYLTLRDRGFTEVARVSVG